MTYGDDLSAAWKEHLKPKEAGARTVVSLFAGCGGSSLGYSMTGYRELLAVEWDDHAASVFRRNFPDVPLHHGDIANVDPAIIGNAQLDVLDGSPPCQGFSIAAHKRKIDDSRNDLYVEFVRLLREWQPKAFVMENVSGMVKGKMRLKFAEILRSLKGVGYHVEARLIDASLLGVPQKRKRLIFIGIRDDLNIEPEYPKPVLPVLTVRDAWAELGDTGIVRSVTPDTVDARLIPLVLPGYRADEVLKSAGKKGSMFAVKRLHWSYPAPTLLKSDRPYLHPEINRYVGTRELTRLQSFPDEFDWGDSSHRAIHARLGNSVPPLMMRAIATAVKDTLDKADQS